MKMRQMSCSWAKNNKINLDTSDLSYIKIEDEVQNSFEFPLHIETKVFFVFVFFKSITYFYLKKKKDLKSCQWCVIL